MKLKLHKYGLAMCAAFVLMVSVASVRAQEGEPVVVDEVVAQVNNDVVTLSLVKQEMREAIESLKQQKNMAQEQAAAEVARRQPELIASLIDEQLLLQKGKELNLTDEVEAEVNKRLLELAKQNGQKNLEELDAAMRQSGIDPAAFRQSARASIMTGMVLSRDVDAKIFYGLSNDEIKKYYEAHRDQFRRPETVTLSEIFLSLAGKNDADVLAKAKDLAAQARKPAADFGALSAAYSEREQNGQRVSAQTKGKLGTIAVPDITGTVATVIKNLKKGDVSDPIRTDEGYLVLRIDDRTAADANATFNENQVREAILNERAPKEREAYRQGLRRDAYIKVADNYKAAVMPLLTTGTAPKGAASILNQTPALTPANRPTARGTRASGGSSNRRP